MSNGIRAPRDIHLSKTTIDLWQRCRLSYKFSKIDKLTVDAEPGAAQLRGNATHDAVSVLLRQGIDPTSARGAEVIESVVSGYGLNDGDAENAAYWASDAARWALERGGQLRWIEDLLCFRRSGVALWAKSDVAVVGGSHSPLEVIDIKTGAWAETPEALEASTEAMVSRCVAGGCEPDQTLRPIAVTQWHAPTAQEVVIWPSNSQVHDWWFKIKGTAEEIRAARANNLFPATTGTHCHNCKFRQCCPAFRAFDDQLPL